MKIASEGSCRFGDTCQATSTKQIKGTSTQHRVRHRGLVATPHKPTKLRRLLLCQCPVVSSG